MKKRGIGYKIRKLAIKFQKTFKAEGVVLNVPKGHSLPLYYSQYPLYDRFLPILSSCLSPSGVFVDVGANIGDTLAFSISNCKNNFVCVEASPFFAIYFSQNVSLFPDIMQKRVVLHSVLAGTGAVNGVLEHKSARTASINTDKKSSEIPTVSLDLLLEKEEDVAIIKSDTDGFDWDVLASAFSICRKHEPILFWENEVNTEQQREGFYKAYDMLQSIGYSEFYVFDNFGTLLLEKASIESLYSLTNYIYSMAQNKAQRTFYYVDVLACTPKKKSTVEEAILKFKKYQEGL